MGLIVRPWTGVEPVDLDPDLAGDVELWNPYLLVAPPLVFLVLARLEGAGEVEAGSAGLGWHHGWEWPGGGESVGNGCWWWRGGEGDVGGAGGGGGKETR